MASSVNPDYAVDDLAGVDLIHWNPERPAVNGGAPQPVDNFGDLLGPLVAQNLRERLAIRTTAPARRRLLTVGSILHFAEQDDVVWGSGVNGKALRETRRLPSLDVRAVRGPFSRRILLEQGIAVPAVFGDPALILPSLFPRLVRLARTKSRPVTIIPNLNDYDPDDTDPRIVSPTGELWSVLEAIAVSELVVGSSLHAIIVAEALGIPARAVRSERESFFKYLDYYAGTGRMRVEVAESVDAAVAMGGVAPGTCDLGALIAAFPMDLWDPEEHPASAPDSARELPNWVALVNERWSARQYGTQLTSDTADAFRSDIVVPLIDTAWEMPDADIADAVRGAGALAGALPATSEVHPRERQAIELLRSGDVDGVRLLSKLAHDGVNADLLSSSSDREGLRLDVLVRMDSTEGEPDFVFTATHEASGEQFRSPVLARLDDKGGGAFRWTQQVPYSALRLAGVWVFGIEANRPAWETAVAKLKHTRSTTVVMSRAGRYLAMSVVAEGKFVFVTRKP